MCLCVLCVCARALMRVCTHVLCVCVCVYVCACALARIHVHVCECICMYSGSLTMKDNESKLRLSSVLFGTVSGSVGKTCCNSFAFTPSFIVTNLSMEFCTINISFSVQIRPGWGVKDFFKI